MFCQYFITPKYESSITLYVERTVGYDEQKEEDSSELISTCIEISESENVCEDVADCIEKITHRSFSQKEIGEMTTVERVKDSAIIKISVRHEEPATAREVANRFSQCGIEKMDMFISKCNVNITEKSMKVTKLCWH